MIVDTQTDTHVHTSLCNHATGSMEDYVKAAISKGLGRIIFLEHLEEGINASFRTWLTEADFDHYFEQGHELQHRYRGQIEIGLGAEVGYNPNCVDTIIERLNRRTWDLIGLSCHFCKIPGHNEHLNLLSRRKKNFAIIEEYGCEKMLSHYFNALIEGVQKIPAQVLCHLDAGLRHQPRLSINDRHREQINILFREVKLAGMSVEINTSGFDYRNQQFPATEFLRKARKSGISFTAASDAHKPSEVGRHFEKIPELFE